MSSPSSSSACSSPTTPKKLMDATKANTGATASPFVVAIQLSGIPHLPGILNGCILIFVFSASNSDLYIASRTIYGLAKKERPQPSWPRLTPAVSPITPSAYRHLSPCWHS